MIAQDRQNLMDSSWEPSDEQLEALILSVAADIRAKAAVANKAMMDAQTVEVLSRHYLPTMRVVCMTGQRPTLVVIAGPNGSGKTFLTTKILQHGWIAGCTYINQSARERCLKLRESVVFESVMSAPDKIDFIRRAKDEGYFIRLFFVCTDHPFINASRVAQRVMEGGHDVPITKIISRYSKSIANCAIAATFVDRAYIYDNSVDGSEPKLLFRTVEGKIVKTYDAVHDWARVIIDALPYGCTQEESHRLRQSKFKSSQNI